MSMRRLFLLVFLVPGISGADPEIRRAPAEELTIPTQIGRYLQLQVERDGEWVNDGVARQGDGKPFSILKPAGRYRAVNPSDQWVLVWTDEFNGEDIDFTKWAREENNYGGGNNERQAYRTDPKYSYVEDGKLHIAVYREPHTTSDGKTQPYSSARLRTMNRGDWKYGRFAIRAKLPDGQGIWPAIWMMPTRPVYGTWAASGEIDIVESRGSQVQETLGALHFGGTWPRNTHIDHTYRFPDKNAAEAFHVYGLEWSEDEISWFVDGVKWKTRSKDEWWSENARQNASAPFDQTFHLILNVAVDGRFFENVDQRADRLPASAFPQVMEVDYVRVYQWAD